MNFKFKVVDRKSLQTEVAAWDRFSFEDGKEDESPVRRVMLDIEAGCVARVVVARHPLGLNVGDDPPVAIEEYFVVKDDQNVTLNLVRISKPKEGED